MVQLAKQSVDVLIGPPENSIWVPKYSVDVLLDPNNSIPLSKLSVDVLLGPEDVVEDEDEDTEQELLEVNLSQAKYRAILNDNSQTLLLTDARGRNFVYANNEEFYGDEYFDRFASGDDAVLEKLTDSIEGEFVNIEVPENTKVHVSTHGKTWRFRNPSEGQIIVEIKGKQFRIDAGDALMFPMNQDFAVSHEQSGVVVLNVWVD